ncbi:hypothetical protein Pla8534_41650 [Lignipirellula cremea]|uniref:Uncharacterized protein n=1 Tax=Lignipirellula cremea TaxID=2528010 RepID=A0A518DWY4_9BACT|nr:hypothetical protein Pla8534_41650 [Lignipirellula cremea]
MLETLTPIPVGPCAHLLVARTEILPYVASCCTRRRFPSPVRSGAKSHLSPASNPRIRSSRLPASGRTSGLVLPQADGARTCARGFRWRNGRQYDCCRLTAVRCFPPQAPGLLLGPFQRSLALSPRSVLSRPCFRVFAKVRDHLLVNPAASNPPRIAFTGRPPGILAPPCFREKIPVASRTTPVQAA